MKIPQVAAQLYTVRQHLKTPADLAASLKKIKQTGYQAIQLASIGSIPEDDLASMMADVGLICCSAHEDAETIVGEPQRVAERLTKYGCKLVSYPHPHVKLDTLDSVKALAASLNAAGKVFHDAGITLTYHNHSGEFRRFDGRLILEIIYAETDPKYLQGEVDTYWVQYGGGDSEDWCRSLKGRLPALHMKDYKTKPDGSPTWAEIGQGNLTWKPIIAAAEESGCQWYIVEQDRCDGDPFDSVRISFEYIRDNLCS